MLDNNSPANIKTPTTKTPSNNNTPSKRNRESPGSSDNLEKKLKSAAMTQNGDVLQSILEKLKKLDKLDDLQTELSAVKSTVNSIQSTQKEINDRLDSLSQEVITISSNQNATDHNLQCLGSELADLKQKVSQIDLMKNQLEQQLLSNDISAFGIPAKYAAKPEEMIFAFNNCLDLQLTKSSFKFIRFMNKKKLSTCNAFFRFSDSATKSTFMSAVADLAKGADGQRHPLTIEDIFEEYKDPNELTGREIHFSNSLTLFNGQIIKLKSTVKQEINFMWEQDGRILMKYNATSKIVQALSPQHVLDYATKSPNPPNISKELSRAKPKS